MQILEGFDYKKPAQSFSTDAACPPRRPQHRSEKKKKTMAWTSFAAHSRKRKAVSKALI